MENNVGMERCLSFINCQLQPGGRAGRGASDYRVRAAVTISRQAGCGAQIVAEKLAQRLQVHCPKDAPPWTVFDRNLMEKVLADHNLPARLAQFLPEDRMSELQDMLEESLGLHPATRTVVQQISETILHLGGLGHVIVIGRGGNVITAALPHVLHVRLVAPLEKRIEHAREFYDLTPRAAREFCLRDDAGRRRYLRKYFRADIDDPLRYHLVVNTGVVSYDAAAKLIADAVLTRHMPVAVPSR